MRVARSRLQGAPRSPLVLLLVVALLATACGGGDDGGDATTDGGPTASGAPASLAIIDPGVDVADAEAAETFRPGEDGESLIVDDQVRTSDAGFAEVNWTAGALARIGPGSLYRLETLALEADAPQVTARLDVGRAWNRVEGGAIDAYDVTTAVGTASVRGTAFDVNCTDRCTIAVVDGVVNMTTTLGIDVEVRAGEQVTVEPTGIPGEVVPLVVDDWITDNVARDTARNFDELDVAGIAQGRAEDTEGGEGRSDEGRARLDGTYDLAITIEDSSIAEQEGAQDTRVYTFTPDCETGPCGGDWDPGDGRTVAFTWTGSGYAAAYLDREAFLVQACTDAGLPSYIEDFVFTITPTQAAEVDGELMVTAFDHEWDTVLEPHPDAIEAGCVGPDTVTAHVVGNGTRRA